MHVVDLPIMPDVPITCSPTSSSTSAFVAPLLFSTATPTVNGVVKSSEVPNFAMKSQNSGPNPVGFNTRFGCISYWISV